MTDFLHLAREILDELERGESDAVCERYADTLHPWVPKFLRTGDWDPFLRVIAGSNRRLIEAVMTSQVPPTVRLMLEGDRSALGMTRLGEHDYYAASV